MPSKWKDSPYTFELQMERNLYEQIVCGVCAAPQSPLKNSQVLFQ